MAARILESLTFINILVKLCIYPYIINHVMCIALFGKQEYLESSQESQITSKKIYSVGPLNYERWLLHLPAAMTVLSCSYFMA